MSSGSSTLTFPDVTEYHSLCVHKKAYILAAIGYCQGNLWTFIKLLQQSIPDFVTISTFPTSVTGNKWTFSTKKPNLSDKASLTLSLHPHFHPQWQNTILCYYWQGNNVWTFPLRNQTSEHQWLCRYVHISNLSDRIPLTLVQLSIIIYLISFIVSGGTVAGRANQTHVAHM